VGVGPTHSPLTFLTDATLAPSVAADASMSLTELHAHSVQSFSSHVPALFHTERDMAARVPQYVEIRLRLTVLDRAGVRCSTPYREFQAGWSACDTQRVWGLCRGKELLKHCRALSFLSKATRGNRRHSQSMLDRVNSSKAVLPVGRSCRVGHTTWERTEAAQTQ